MDKGAGEWIKEPGRGKGAEEGVKDEPVWLEGI